MMDPNLQQLEIARRQVMAMFWQDTAWIGLFSLYIFGFIRYVLWLRRKFSRGGEWEGEELMDEGWHFVAVFFCIIGVAAVSLIMVADISENIGRLVNPDYYAMQLLLSMGK